MAPIVAGNHVKLAADPTDISINETVDLLTPGWITNMVSIGEYLITTGDMVGPNVFADPSSVIFTDRFESGDTALWSGVAP